MITQATYGTKGLRMWKGDEVWSNGGVVGLTSNHGASTSVEVPRITQRVTTPLETYRCSKEVVLKAIRYQCMYCYLPKLFDVFKADQVNWLHVKYAESNSGNVGCNMKGF